ncbi:L,D-transpeptidase family protein [Streptomyces sp. NPDC087263]|uniref:L,D-transpeptidase family protein n=1 Tax=Streptomyces sp. NPDC087263 TaxID=3365773 RepID=UPI0038267C15
MTSSIRRLPRRRLLGTHCLGIPAVVLALSVTIAGCAGAGAGARAGAGTGAGAVDAARSADVGTHAASGNEVSAESAPTLTPTHTPAQLPGLGTHTLSEIPANARQVVLVTGQGRNSSASQVVLYQRTGTGTGTGWEPGAAWPAHNALKGWTDDHHAGDLRSPIGVFALTDAGGLLADPGTKLPYDQSQGFTIGGTGFEGEPLAGSFDYVIAINYNREPGTSPLDWTRPLGTGKGGGIWLHVDHGGPTHGCVSLEEDHLEQLLRTLDPDRHPVIVMGDAESLER